MVSQILGMLLPSLSSNLLLGYLLASISWNLYLVNLSPPENFSKCLIYFSFLSNFTGLKMLDLFLLSLFLSLSFFTNRLWRMVYGSLYFNSICFETITGFKLTIDYFDGSFTWILLLTLTDYFLWDVSLFVYLSFNCFESSTIKFCFNFVNYYLLTLIFLLKVLNLVSQLLDNWQLFHCTIVIFFNFIFLNYLNGWLDILL